MLWGALNNATQGMMATSSQMGTISQNISNLNTVGYKNRETLFKTLLSESKAAPMAGTSGLNIFTVHAADRTHVQAQGVVTATSHWSDLAINGRGFFMVAPPTGEGVPPTSPDPASAESVLYTRAGAFQQIARPDGNNYFVTSSGQYLLGWQASPDGVITEGGTLQPVYTTPETAMAGQATSEARILANLPSNAQARSTSFTSTTSLSDPGPPITPRTVNLNWQRVDGNTWSVTPVLDDPSAGTIAPTSFTVTQDAWGNTTLPAPPYNISVAWNSTGTTVADVLPTLGTAPPNPHLETISLPVFDDQGNQQTAALSFERVVGPVGGVNANRWYMHVPGATSTPVEIIFDSEGQLLSPQSAAVALSFTTPVAGTANVTVDLSNLEQYASSSIYIRQVEQNGFPDGQLRYARFNSVGELEGTFDNGETRLLFKLPVATFISENNLEAISGTLFRRSVEAGEVTVQGIDSVADGGGYISSSALENSTVNIEDEFTRMIMTQKAYSTNATVFKTADEMTTVARDLK